MRFCYLGQDFQCFRVLTFSLKLWYIIKICDSHGVEDVAKWEYLNTIILYNERMGSTFFYIPIVLCDLKIQT